MNAPQDKVLTKSKMYSFYLEDPKSGTIERDLNDTRMQYFYFDKDLELKTEKNEVLNGCILSGDCTLVHNTKSHEFNQFDIFFLPPEDSINIKINLESGKKHKICLYYYNTSETVDVDFDIQHFELSNFIARGENGSESKMATFRTVWTAIKNGFFMSGFTNIPNDSLKQGVITSVNLEKNNENKIEIYPHIHPEYPEVYIMCIDDEKYAISQYLINTEGQTICKDLSDGEGLFFPGYLGHSNFARPFYKNISHCMYYWCIPTFGSVDLVSPITLKV